MKEKTMRAIHKCLSLFFAVAIFLTIQGCFVMTETVEQGDLATRAREMPANPVHHCTKRNDGTDITDWSYVYFGSYPQTEVTGDALTAAITDAAYDSNGDAWVNGTKYRRISKSDTNHDGYFGNSTYRCFKWENCTIRNWLNNDFYGTAFSSGEQGAIVEQSVVNEDNPYYDGTEGGNDTRDKIFLLSIGEVTNPDYGFCEDASTDSASRWMQVSDSAHAMGASTYSSGYTGGNANGWWWLRSPGYYTDYAARVGRNGYLNRDGDYVDDDTGVVVPALHINLSSDRWSAVDDGTSGEGGMGVQEVDNPFR